MKTNNIIEKEIKPSVAGSLKSLETCTNQCAVFEIDRLSTVRNSIQRLNEKGMRFITRTEDGKVYVWRIA